MFYKTGGLAQHPKPLLCLTMIAFTSACGGGGGSDGATPTTPASVNAVPVLATANADQSATVGTSFSYDAVQNGSTFNDADGDALTYTITFAPNANGLTASNGQISGTPEDDIEVTVTISANDGNGGSVSDSFTIASIQPGTDQDAIVAVSQGRVNLDNLENYANQAVPDYIAKLNDGGNPITDAGATLGRVLFYDKALSIDDTISCASCHSQTHAFGDPAIISTGVESGQTVRHSMRLINTQFAEETNFFWDERASSHEDQESQPLRDEDEHGFSGINGRPDFNNLIEKLEALERYQELFSFAFGDPAITEERIENALAQFTKSIFSFDSKFDIGRAQVFGPFANFPNFSANENAGKQLFFGAPQNGGAGCARCHRPPEFDIRPESGHNGIFRVAQSITESDLSNTRSPSLRDLANPEGIPNGPFMHDGSLDTLLDVVNHYDDVQAPTTEPLLTEWRNSIDNQLIGNGNNPQSLNLTTQEKAQLVAFLETLSGANVYTDTKWSDPFTAPPPPVVTQDQPNIVLVITDDQGLDASAEYSLSNDLPNTPNFSAMAQNGIIFDNVWVNPSCSPTRAALISGKFGHRTNVLAPGDPLPTTDVVLQSFLKAHTETSDYASALIGKWHLGGGNTGPNDFGIDYFAGITGGGVQNYFDWTLNINGTNTSSTNYVTTELTDLAIDWVEDQNQPWFLWLAYNAPHTPFHLPPTDLHNRNLSGEQADIDANERDYYLASIEAMDTEFGRFWNSLSAEEQQNTIVLFLGDNGTPGQIIDRNINQSGSKGTLLDGGINTPMFVAGAGVTRQGQREDALITQTDFFPTIVELAGAELASYEDGESFMSLLANQGDARDYSYTVSNNGFTIRNDRHKLIEATNGSQELYDLLADPDESDNLIGGATDVSAIVTELANQAALFRQ